MKKINYLLFFALFLLFSLHSCKNDPELIRIKTINSTAGAVSGFFSHKEKGIIKGIIITGEIDSRDFQFIQDSLISLTFLDLSEASIVAFGSNPPNGIPEYAFFHPSQINKTNTTLNYIILPNTTKFIGQFAFAYCEGIKIILIPKSVIDIDQYAFARCSGFITVVNDNPNYMSQDSVLFDKSQTTIIKSCNTKNGAYIIPSTVTLIDNYAFALSYKLTAIKLPESITEIRMFAFQNCTGLKTIILPSKLEFILDGAFYGCTNLSSIYNQNPQPISLSTLIEPVFTGVDKSKCTLYVPVGSKALYQSADVWKDFTNIVEL